MQTDIRDLFDEQGPFSQILEGYQPRPQQIDMAEQVATALHDREVLVAEAGTGTGKTYAYLTPAILSGQKVFVSTGTKNLQDQLFNNDIPTLRKVLAVPFTASLLKGRSNYVCPYRLNQTAMEPEQTDEQLDTIEGIRKWMTISTSGDLSETSLLEAQSSLWPKVTSTIDNCLGQQCPNIDECFVVEARRKAQEADIVVVNHHLLMSDMALKTTGQGEVLPDADAFIIDEAHQLPSVASQFLGFRLSSHQIHELARDSIKEMNADASDMANIGLSAERLESQLHQLKLTLDGDERREPLDSFYENQLKFKSQLNELYEVVVDLAANLEEAESRSRGLALCKERALSMGEKINQFLQLDESDMVYWIEAKQSQFVLQATPQQLGETFQAWIEHKQSSWIFTSATMTVAGKFNNFNQRLGLVDPVEGMWPSPFDYAQQSLLYMPAIPVEPNHVQYNRYIGDIAKDVIKYSHGRTFLLFTSYKAMYEVAEQLDDLPYPILVQRGQGKHQLLDEFKAHGNAVLLGTSSFWEGVDVRGEALSCVMIDKLPFSAPDDPVLQARINYLKTHGGNPFQSIQIPDAVIQLKQGIGRLLRDENDRGLLVLCDPRLLNKPYGKQFLRSLPAMPITQSIKDVATFFQQEE